MEVELVNVKIKLDKFPGKGGWTYARLPVVKPDKHNYFGWVRVKGYIDDYEIKQYHLMPTGDGSLFLPVKISIRRIIGKQAGDIVHIRLFKDDSALEVPPDFLECLHDEPKAFRHFQELEEKGKKRWIDYIQKVKSEAARTGRMAIAINSLAEGKPAPQRL